MSPFRPGSLRFRLTAIATAVAAVVLIGTAVAVLSVQDRQLTANLDASLEQRADTIEAQLESGDAPATIPTDDEDRAVQLVAVDGAVLIASTNLTGAPAFVDPPAAGADQAISSRDDLPLEDDTYRVLARDVETRAGSAVLYVAENTDDLNEALTNLTRTLALAVPAAIALLAALIWWLTGRTLGPVDSIRAEVDAITATNSQQRVHAPPRHDESSIKIYVR